MRVAISTGLTYTPEWGDNRSLPQEEQIVVHYRYLTGPERDSLYGLGAIPIEVDTEGKMPPKVSFKMDREGIVKACTVKIDNLTVNEKKAALNDLFTVPELAGLYDELADFYLEQNREMDKKKQK